MKKQWKIVKIPEVLFFQEGPGVRKHQFTSEGVKLLNVGNINDGQINLSKTKVYISEEEAFGKYKHFLVDDGDLVIASSGIVVDNFHNKIAFVQKKHLPLIMNTSTIRFKPLDNTVIDISYFNYFLKTRYFTDQLKKLITGSAQLNFGPSHLGKMNLLLPSLSEQKIIVKILDQANSLCQKRKQTSELLNDYLKSIFLEMFKDTINNLSTYQPIGKATNFIDYRGKTPEKSNSGIPLLTAKHVKKGFFQFNPEEYITEQKYNEIMTRGFPRPNDVLFTTEGATLGNVCRIPRNINRFGVGQRLITLQCRDSLTPEYLQFILLNGKIRNEIFKQATGSAAQGIRSAVFSKIHIPIPSKELQEKFSLIVQNSESIKQKMLIQSQELEIQFQAFMQKSFQYD